MQEKIKCSNCSVLKFQLAQNKRILRNFIKLKIKKQYTRENSKNQQQMQTENLFYELKLNNSQQIKNQLHTIQENAISSFKKIKNPQNLTFHSKIINFQYDPFEYSISSSIKSAQFSMPTHYNDSIQYFSNDLIKIQQVNQQKIIEQQKTKKILNLKNLQINQLKAKLLISQLKKDELYIKNIHLQHKINDIMQEIRNKHLIQQQMQQIQQTYSKQIEQPVQYKCKKQQNNLYVN